MQKKKRINERIQKEVKAFILLSAFQVLNEMKNNAIKTSNKISNNNSNSQSTYTGNTKSGTNRNESEESLMNKFSGTNDISQHEDCLTNSCSRFNKLTNFSSPSSEQNLPTTENDVKAEISTSFTMEANPNSSKIPVRKEILTFPGGLEFTLFFYLYLSYFS